MFKDMRRAERRWKSFHAWMRRLQDDWWEHGTRENPRAVYRLTKEKGVCPFVRGEDSHEGSRWRCPCLKLTDNAATHFKDHPTGSKSRRAHDLDWEPGGLKRNDLARLPVEREDFSRNGRKHREGTHPVKVACNSCGFLLNIIQVKNGQYIRGVWGVRCRACAKKEKRKFINYLDGGYPVQKPA